MTSYNAFLIFNKFSQNESFSIPKKVLLEEKELLSKSVARSGLFIAELIKKSIIIKVEWKNENLLKINKDVLLSSSVSICRYLTHCMPEMLLYGNNCLEKVEIDHWISFSIGPLINNQKFKDSIKYLDNALNSLTYLVGHRLTIADLLVWNTLFCNHNWNKLLHFHEYKNIKRWFYYIENLKEVKLVLSSLPDLHSKPKNDKIFDNKDEGKFIDLPHAKKGEVVVRFPPEASGYLHIGHAKAALLNQYYKELFEGKLIMRFDDTNPEKEKVDFEKVILEDLYKLLKVYPDKFTHTSDYFDELLKMCEKLLNQNLAYVDDTEPEIMKKEREQKKMSKNRQNSIEKNFEMWSEMLKGTTYGQKCCVRAKIDMNSDNGCLRDPTIYRCKNEPHPRTGSKYKVYPTYDFACPIVDSIEGVTHALRTMEYHDRDDQFNWFIEVLNLRKVYIWEYSRLNMMNTVLSKRKLTWFVDEKIVDSWEDPRLPTVRGIVRRGLTIEGLKQFIIAQGSSRTVVQMEWDKIWAFNKKIIDPIAPRYTALKKNFTVLVNVKGSKTEKLTVPKHPKNPSLGTKEIWTGSSLLIEKADAELLKENDNVTFINWGNLKIKKINRDFEGSIASIDAETNLNDTNFKKTLKLTWLTNVECLTPIKIYYYDHIITKPVLGKDEDFKKYVNYNSKNFINYVGEENLRNLEVGDIIQLQRIGFFRCDIPFKSNSEVVLIHIPDGSNKSQLNYSESSSKTSQLSSDIKENEKLFLKNKFVDYKSLPISSQELEQIAVQWRNGRRDLEAQKEVQSIKEKKKNNQKKKENKKAIPDNIDTEKISVAKTSRTRLGLEATKEDNLAEWYSQVITKSELIEYYDISGCYILRPWSFALWEVIQNFLDKEIKSLGVQNCYFPIFVTKSVLEREKTHIEDFAPEVAWVTKSGMSDLAEYIAIRPTSETVMYPAFAKWIQSYRDLPIKLNQWNNVVRWEFKHPQPFLRTREFLWQEGHTAFSSAKEAQDEVYKVLNIYSKVYQDLLAVPIIKGWKTKKEKFAGSDFTTTVEAFVSASGRGIQAATSHHLGQNFSKMFDIIFEDPDTKEKKFVFQNSWGLTTRSLGIMIMVHSDNKGLVLPPNAAALQIIIIPCGITVNLKEEEKNYLLTACKTFEVDFCKAGIRAKFDDRANYSPGWKFNHWELKGVPVRIELGPRDYEKKQFVAVRRDNGEKKILDFDNKVENIKELLNEIQESMFRKAKKELNDHIIQSKNWNDFCCALDKKNIILAPFCEEESCEDNIKKDSVRVEEIETGAPAMGAKSLCIPFDQPSVIQKEDKCIHPKCKNKPIRYTLFGRSY